MTETSWYCAEADRDGFLSFERLRAEARRSDREAFLDRYPAPALLVLDPGGSGGGQDLAEEQGGVQLLTVTVETPAILRYLNKVAFVCKRPGNAYAHLVSVGRSAKNDITLAVDTVSKVHGYFVRDDTRWSFTDHGSTNGSRLNEEKLGPAEKHLLHDGDVLQLGLGVRLLYLGPEALFERARQG